jgi:hypothetical protein
MSEVIREVLRQGITPCGPLAKKNPALAGGVALQVLDFTS